MSSAPPSPCEPTPNDVVKRFVFEPKVRHRILRERPALHGAEVRSRAHEQTQVGSDRHLAADADVHGAATARRQLQRRIAIVDHTVVDVGGAPVEIGAVGGAHRQVIAHVDLGAAPRAMDARSQRDAQRRGHREAPLRGGGRRRVAGTVVVRVVVDASRAEHVERRRLDHEGHGLVAADAVRRADGGVHVVRVAVRGVEERGGDGPRSRPGRAGGALEDAAEARAGSGGSRLPWPARW